MTTVADIRATLKSNPGLTQVSSVMNCGRINSMLRVDIAAEFDLAVEPVHGCIPSRDPTRSGRAQHLWLQIPADHIEDTTGAVIVDGALDQFTAANYDTHESVTAALNPDGETISSLVVATPAMSVYQYYTEATPVHG